MTGHNPTDRSKLGTKRHILTDKDGIPLSTIITSANTHDVTVAIDTVESLVINILCQVTNSVSFGYALFWVMIIMIMIGIGS